SYSPAREEAALPALRNYLTASRAGQGLPRRHLRLVRRLRDNECRPHAQREQGGARKARRIERPQVLTLRFSDWRPGSESNRRTRLCRPLHDHSATRPVTLFGVFAAYCGPPEKTKPRRTEVSSMKLERETRLELATPTLA